MAPRKHSGGQYGKVLELEDQRRVSASDKLLHDPNRLRALHAAGLMDTPQEEVFDRLARLAARMLRVPLTIVSLMSDTRQFFKASYGLSAPYDTEREVPIDASICRYTLNGEPLVVENTATDLLMRHHPATKKWGIAALMALPLTTVDGHVLGTFCAVDTIRRRWTADELSILQELAASVMTEIALRKRLNQAQALWRQREEVLATIAHDLRTPITVASLVAQRLADTPSDLRLVHKSTSRIVACMSRTGCMISDLLDASQLQAGKTLRVDCRWHAAGDLFADIVDELAQLHDARFALTAPPQGCQIFCDARAMRRIVENLAENAVKYGASHTPIAIRVGPAQQQLRIEVHNVGDPIPLHEQPLLFEPYRRAAGAMEGRQPGWGIGLSLVRGLVEAHHGKVSVRSSRRLGTTFAVEMPHFFFEQPWL